MQIVNLVLIVLWQNVLHYKIDFNKLKTNYCPLKTLLFRKKKQKAFSVPRPKNGDLNFLTPKKKLTRRFSISLVFLINQKSLNSDLKIISFACRQFSLWKPEIIQIQFQLCKFLQLYRIFQLSFRRKNPHEVEIYEEIKLL